MKKIKKGENIYKRGLVCRENFLNYKSILDRQTDTLNFYLVALLCQKDEKESF